MPREARKELSTRERQVLLLLSTRKRSVEIAQILGLSKHTINNHRKKILKKTGCKSTLEMVHWGLRKGLIR